MALGGALAARLATSPPSGFWLRDYPSQSLAPFQLPARSDEIAFGVLGSGPLVRGEPIPFGPVKLDANCVDDVQLMATDLTSRGVRLVLVLFPYMPAWIEATDGTGKMRAEFLAGVRNSISGTGATLVDATAMALPNKDFADPFHLQWPEVPHLRDTFGSARSGSRLPIKPR